MATNKVRVVFDDGRDITIVGKSYEDVADRISKATGCDNGMRRGDRRIKFVPFKVYPIYN